VGINVGAITTAGTVGEGEGVNFAGGTTSNEILGFVAGQMNGTGTATGGNDLFDFVGDGFSLSGTDNFNVALGVSITGPTMSGTSVLNQFYGLEVQSPSMSGSATMSSARGLYIQNMGGAGITNAYGLYIATQTGASTNYAIYADSGGFTVDGSGNTTVDTLTSGGTIAGGTTFSIASGCGTPSSLTGGATTGSFVANTTSCSPVLTLPTAPHGWWCNMIDVTHPADTFTETAKSATSCTMTVASAVSTSDVILFHAEAY
jgi:hypothetical protein